MRRTVVALALLMQPAVCLADLPIVFNFPAGADPTQIWIQFPNNGTGTYLDTTGTPQPIVQDTAYSLAQITSPVSIAPGNVPANVPAVLMSQATDRLYISFGNAGLQGMGGGYQPDPTNVADPNYNTRYQFVEPGIVTTGPSTQVNADLTYIDFTSISLSMAAVNAPSATNTPQLSQSGQQLVTASAGSALVVNNNVLPGPADVLPSPNFARVISPGLATSGTYHDFTHYLQTTLQGQSIQLAGLFFGVGTQPTGNPETQQQSYDFTATFNPSGDVTIVANPGSGNGSAAGVPPALQGPGVGDVNQTITATFAQLNATVGIYGNNPSYTIDNNGSITNTTGITNDIWGRVMGDLVAGLSYGYAGSTTLYNGTPIGSLNSTEWWGGKLADGTVIAIGDTPFGNNLAFGNVQANSQDYNSYAGSLFPLTYGYAFPLGDRPGQNLMAFNTGTDANAYLEITINADAIPEPGSLGLVGVGVVALAGYGIRRRRAKSSLASA